MSCPNERRFNVPNENWIPFPVPHPSTRLIMSMASGGNGTRRFDRPACEAGGWVFGFGAFAAAFREVLPTDTLQVAVGKGSGGLTTSSYPGGGLSAVAKAIPSPASINDDLVVLAGGGGGTAKIIGDDLCLKCSLCPSANSSAGKESDGSGHKGCDRYRISGEDCTNTSGGQGGTVLAGGAGGSGSFASGQAGSFLQGGNASGTAGGGGGGLYGGGGGALFPSGFSPVRATGASGGAGSSWTPALAFLPYPAYLTSNQNSAIESLVTGFPFVDLFWATLQASWNASLGVVRLDFCSTLRPELADFVWKQLFEDTQDLFLYQDETQVATVQGTHGGVDLSGLDCSLYTYTLRIRDTQNNLRIAASVDFARPLQVVAFAPQVACSGQLLSIVGTSPYTWAPFGSLPVGLTYTHTSGSNDWKFNNATGGSLSATFGIVGDPCTTGSFSVVVSPNSLFFLPDIFTCSGTWVSVPLEPNDAWTITSPTDASFTGAPQSGTGSMFFLAAQLTSQVILDVDVLRDVLVNNGSTTRLCQQSSSFTLTLFPVAVLTSPLVNLQIGALSNLVLMYSGPSATVTWTLDPTSHDIGLETSGSGITIPIDGTKTPSSGTAVYDVTLTSLPEGCPTSWRVQVTLVLSDGGGSTIDQVVCSGQVLPIQNIDSWQAQPGPPIGLPGTSGSGDLTFTACNTSGVPLTRVVDVALGEQITHIGITVFPRVDLILPPNMTVCSGQTVDRVSFESTGPYPVSWTRSPGDFGPGLLLDGTNSVSPWTAVNKETYPLVVDFTVTVDPSSSCGPCAPVTGLWSITVLPEPRVQALPPAFFCAANQSSDAPVRILDLPGIVAPSPPSTVWDVQWTLDGDHVTDVTCGTTQVQSDDIDSWADLTLPVYNFSFEPRTIVIRSRVTDPTTGCLIYRQSASLTVLPYPRLESLVPDVLVVCPGEPLAVSFEVETPNTEVQWTLFTASDQTPVAPNLPESGTGNLSIAMTTPSGGGGAVTSMTFTLVSVWDLFGQVVECSSEPHTISLQTHLQPTAPAPRAFEFCERVPLAWLSVGDTTNIEFVWQANGAYVGETFEGHGPTIGSEEWVNTSQEPAVGTFYVRHRDLTTGCLSDPTVITVVVFPLVEVSSPCSNWFVVAGQAVSLPLSSSAPFVLETNTVDIGLISDQVLDSRSLSFEVTVVEPCTSTEVSLQAVWNMESEACPDQHITTLTITVVSPPTLVAWAPVSAWEGQHLCVSLSLQPLSCTTFPVVGFTWTGGATVGLCDHTGMPKPLTSLEWLATSFPSDVPVTATIEVTSHIPKQFCADTSAACDPCPEWVAGPTQTLQVTVTPIVGDRGCSVDVRLCAGETFTYTLPVGVTQATFVATNAHLGTPGDATEGVIDSTTSFQLTLAPPLSASTCEQGVIRIFNAETPIDDDSDGLVCVLYVTVTPIPALELLAQDTSVKACHGETVEIQFAVLDGAKVRWENSNTTIGLPTEGEGSSIQFVAQGTWVPRCAKLVVWSEMTCGNGKTCKSETLELTVTVSGVMDKFGVEHLAKVAKVAQVAAVVTATGAAAAAWWKWAHAHSGVAPKNPPLETRPSDEYNDPDFF